MNHIVSEIIVTDAGHLDTELNKAVKAAVEFAAQEKRHGILVTRHEFSRFTVALTPDVPFGLIHEHDVATPRP